MLPLSIRKLTASYSLASKLDPEKCAHILKSLGIKRSTLLDYVYANNVKISAVHMKLTAFKDLKSLINELRRLVESAVQAGSHVILFPALTGLLPLTVDKNARDTALQFVHSLTGGKQNDKELAHQLKDLADRFSDFLFDCYYNLFLMLSHQFNIYIAAGSTYVQTGEGIVCRSYLFSPDQDDAFFQDKMHLSALEHRLGVQPGNEMNAIELKIGRTVLLADCDSDYYESYKVAKALGVQIVLSPCSGCGNRFPLPIYNASLMYAQHFNLFAARSSFFSLGDLLPSFSGASGIYGPLAMTKDLDGIVQHVDSVASEPPENSLVVSARVEPPKLADNMDAYSFSTNSDFCATMMNSIYPAYFKEDIPAPFHQEEPE